MIPRLRFFVYFPDSFSIIRCYTKGSFSIFIFQWWFLHSMKLFFFFAVPCQLAQRILSTCTAIQCNSFLLPTRVWWITRQASVNSICFFFIFNIFILVHSKLKLKDKVVISKSPHRFHFNQLENVWITHFSFSFCQQWNNGNCNISSLRFIHSKFSGKWKREINSWSDVDLRWS